MRHTHGTSRSLERLERGECGQRPIARRGMIVLSLAQDEAAFSRLEGAVEEFVKVRARFLA
mgnify:CR=1 FL=1